MCAFPAISDDMADDDHRIVCQHCLNTRMKVASDGLATCSICTGRIDLDEIMADDGPRTVCRLCLAMNLEVAPDDGM